jgi:hypothetical protein
MDVGIMASQGAVAVEIRSNYTLPGAPQIKGG